MRLRRTETNPLYGGRIRRHMHFPLKYNHDSLYTERNYMKTFKKVALAAVIFLLLIIGSSCLVITQEDEYSLIRQFGKVDHVVTEAGISFKLPFVQTVDKPAQADAFVRPRFLGRYHQRQKNHDN